MTIQPAGRGPQLIAVYSFFLAITTVTVVARSYCRLFVVKSFGFDDWLALIAWIFFVLFAAFAIECCFHGNGQHADDIKPVSEIPIGLKWWWACEPVYVLANMAIKASIAVMLLRLTVKSAQKMVIYFTISGTLLYSTFYFFLFVLQCRPSSYFWTQYTGGKGACINPTITVNATYAYSAITCLTDWIFAILPFFLVRKLQMGSRQKVVVGGILAMGAIASTATIIRIPYVHNLSNAADFLYATADVAIWSCCETGLGIAAASSATLRPLFRSFFSNGTSNNNSGGQTASQWPGTVNRRAHSSNGGYVRSHSRGNTDELRLKEGTNKSGWTDVVVGDRDDFEQGHSMNHSPGTDMTDENDMNSRWRSEWDRREREYVSEIKR